MTGVDESGYPADGRVARHERNINAVLDVVVVMFAEDAWSRGDFRFHFEPEMIRR